MSQQRRSHIPKFGSWDADNVPYTAYFENARKDKGTGVMINPNDPEQNPEAFMTYGGDDDTSNDNMVFAEKNVKSGTRKSVEVRSDKSSISEFSNKQQSYKSDRKKSSNSKERISNFSPSSPSPSPSPSSAPNRPRHGYNPADDISSHRSASVPMFGAWDEKDPKSAEGFTVIFQKVKEEKHIAATKFPPIPQQASYNPNTTKNDSTRVKKWCCLF